MVKVAIITPTLSGKGGEETVINDVINSKIMERNNIHFKLIILGKSYSTDWLSKIKPNVSVTNTENEVKNFLYLRKVIKTEKFQDIVCLSRKSILYSYIIRKISNINFAIYSWLHFDLTKVNTRFLSLADYHLAISDGISKQLEEMKIAKPSNIYTIYNPIARNKSFIKKTNNNKLIYVGRITFKGQKDIKELIDNLAFMSNNDWSLEIIGDGTDKQRCQNYLLKKYPELQKKIIWKGWAQNPWKNIKSADALIMTSSYEGLGMVLLEAMSRGLPCLSSRIDGPTSVIKPSINGELYKKGNKKDFETKLRKILQTKFEQQKIKDSISKFYMDTYFKKLVEIFKSGEKHD